MILLSANNGAAVAHPSHPAENITLYPAVDTYVSADFASADMSFSDSLFLNVGRDEFTQEFFTLLRFDLATIPQDAVVVSAEFEAYLSSTEPLPEELCLRRVTADWDSSVTWNTRPTLDDHGCNGLTIGSNTDQYHKWSNLKPLVDAWRDGTYSNFGIALQSTTLNAADKTFHSSENNERPRLIIEYALPQTPTVTPTPSPTPTATPLPTPTSTLTPATGAPFNVQIQAVEVTQGIRGDIPTRTPPGGDLVFIPDTAVHVAGRRTIVRVYPWVTRPAGSSSIPALTVRMWGSRDGVVLPGSPLSPENPFITPVVGDNVQSMRFDAAKSWNFVLPDSWVSEGTILLTIEVNPAGAGHQEECPGCGIDNTAYLHGTRFVRVQEQAITVDMHLIDFYWRDEDGAIQHRRPGLDEIAEAWSWWEKTWPLQNYIRWLRPHWHRMAWDLTVAGGGPVDPPIPGVAGWPEVVNGIRDQYTGIGGPAKPYHYLPMVFSGRTPHGCGGGAAVGAFDVFSTGACGPTITHEAAHTIGRNHSDTVHTGEPVTDYPDPDGHGALETNAVGFDIYALRAIPPFDGSPSSHTHDYMSYGAAPRWTSLYTWQGVAGAFGATTIEPTVATAVQMAARAKAQESYLRLSGKIISGNTVEFSPFFQVSRAAGSHNQQGQGTYRLELRAADQSVLFTRFFAPAIHLTTDEEVDFYELVPVLADMAEIVLLKDGQELGSQAVSSGSPQVQLLSPVDGETWAADGEVTVQWDGSDPDGDTLLYRLEGSPDGENWFILVSGATENSAALDLATIPGGGSWQVRVQASDGVHTAFDEANPVNIAPKAPWVLIETPLENEIIGSGQLITVHGQASDWQEGDLTGAALNWRLDGSLVGSGETFELSNVVDGMHALRLEATNSAGLTGAMEISIWIGADPHTIYLPLIAK